MCDTAEDMDDYIEYEFTRDCIEIDEDCDEFIHDGESSQNHRNESENINEQEFVYTDDDYEIVEELDDEVDQIFVSEPALEIKTEISQQPEQEETLELLLKEETLDQNTEEDHLIDDTENYLNGEEYQEIEYEEVGIEECKWKTINILTNRIINMNT